MYIETEEVKRIKNSSFVGKVPDSIAHIRQDDIAKVEACRAKRYVISRISDEKYANGDGILNGSKKNGYILYVTGDGENVEILTNKKAIRIEEMTQCRLENSSEIKYIGVEVCIPVKCDNTWRCISYRHKDLDIAENVSKEGAFEEIIARKLKIEGLTISTCSYMFRQARCKEVNISKSLMCIADNMTPFESCNIDRLYIRDCVIKSAVDYEELFKKYTGYIGELIIENSEIYNINITDMLSAVRIDSVVITNSKFEGNKCNNICSKHGKIKRMMLSNVYISDIDIVLDIIEVFRVENFSSDISELNDISNELLHKRSRCGRYVRTEKVEGIDSPTFKGKVTDSIILHIDAICHKLKAFINAKNIVIRHCKSINNVVGKMRMCGGILDEYKTDNYTAVYKNGEVNICTDKESVIISFVSTFRRLVFREEDVNLASKLIKTIGVKIDSVQRDIDNNLIDYKQAPDSYFWGESIRYACCGAQYMYTINNRVQEIKAQSNILIRGYMGGVKSSIIEIKDVIVYNCEEILRKVESDIVIIDGCKIVAREYINMFSEASINRIVVTDCIIEPMQKSDAEARFSTRKTKDKALRIEFRNCELINIEEYIVSGLWFESIIIENCKIIVSDVADTKVYNNGHVDNISIHNTYIDDINKFKSILEYMNVDNVNTDMEEILI